MKKNDILFLLLLSFPCLNLKIVEAAVLSGKVMFEGTAPQLEKAKADADPACQAMHPEGITMEDAVVNSNGALKNVFVYIKGGLAGKTFQVPKTAVVLDQKGCHYEPHVLGIQVNQPFDILNSDDTLHNVHALPKNSKEFNLGMPIKGMKLTKTFTAPEVMVKFKCEVHPWMTGYIGVLDHPFYSVTNEEGAFIIKDLPAGEYELSSWHEKYGTLSQQITLTSAEETKELTLQYK